MVECEFCGEEFENEAQMHVHWGEEHEDELNSHQEEKVKKAEKKLEQEKQEIKARRKRLLGYALGGTLTVLLIGFVAIQLLQNMTAGPGQQESFDLDTQPVLGAENVSENNTIQIVEFGDYRCGHCQRFDADHKPQLVENYIENEDMNIEFYWINYPLLGQESVEAAEASECVAEEAGRDSEAFWNFHSALLSTSDVQYTASGLTDVARDATSGLDYDGIQSCISNGEMMDEVNKDISIANGNEVRGTPAIFVNEDRVTGYQYGTVSAAIERKLG